MSKNRNDDDTAYKCAGRWAFVIGWFAMVALGAYLIATFVDEVALRPQRSREMTRIVLIQLGK